MNPDLQYFYMHKVLQIVHDGRNYNKARLYRIGTTPVLTE